MLLPVLWAPALELVFFFFSRLVCWRLRVLLPRCAIGNPRSGKIPRYANRPGHSRQSGLKPSHRKPETLGGAGNSREPNVVAESGHGAYSRTVDSAGRCVPCLSWVQLVSDVLYFSLDVSNCNVFRGCAGHLSVASGWASTSRWPKRHDTSPLRPAQRKAMGKKTSQVGLGSCTLQNPCRLCVPVARSRTDPPRPPMRRASAVPDWPCRTWARGVIFFFSFLAPSQGLAG